MLQNLPGLRLWKFKTWVFAIQFSAFESPNQELSSDYKDPRPHWLGEDWKGRGEWPTETTEHWEGNFAQSN